MCNNENKSTANKTSMYWLNSAICKVAQWCWIIPEPESGAWMEPSLPSSVLQNTTVVDLSLVCNDGRCISYSLSPFGRAAFLWAVSQDYWLRLLLLKTQAVWERRSSSVSPHRTSFDSFSFIQKLGVLNEWRLKVTNVPGFASPRPVDHFFIQQEVLFKNSHLCRWWVEGLTLSAVIYKASAFVLTALLLLLQMRIMQMGQQLFASIGDSSFMYLNETLLWTADGNLLSVLH